MNAFDYVGEWWLADNQANSRVGTLSFSADKGIELELIGSFAHEPMDILTQTRPVFYPTILGLTKEGRFVTLVDSTGMGMTISFPGIPTQKLRCKTAYIGKHHLASDDTKRKFSKATVEFTYLADWIGQTGFHEDHILENGKLSEYHITYKHPGTIDASVSNTSITANYFFETRLNTDNDKAYHQRVVLQLQRTEALSLEEWLNQFVTPLQNLISLATDRPNAIVALFVADGLAEDVSQDSIERGVHLPLEVVFHQVYQDRSEVKHIFDQDMIFSVRDLEMDFSSLLVKWLEVSSVLYTVCNLYFSTRYNPGAYIEPRFLSVVQAVELYHRVRIGSTVFSEEEFQQRKKKILDSIPEEYRDWVRDQLAVSNEARLSQRVTELYELTKDVTGQLYGNKEAFVKLVRDTRNYYTHYGSQLSSKAAHGVSLYWLTEALSYMLIRCFLHEMGFSSKRCVELLSRNQRFLFAKEQVTSVS